jgi:hypothetical protein
MLLPTSVDLLRCIERTLETVIAPALTGLGERSAAATMGHLLRHVRVRIEREGPMLNDEIGVVRPLLGQAEEYLSRLPPDDLAATQLRSRIGGLVGSTRNSGGYRGVASLAEEVSALRQGVCDVLVLLQNRTAGEDPDADRLRVAIQRYIVWEAEQEATIIDPAFEGFGPRS